MKRSLHVDDMDMFTFTEVRRFVQSATTLSPPVEVYVHVPMNQWRWMHISAYHDMYFYYMMTEEQRDLMRKHVFEIGSPGET